VNIINETPFPFVPLVGKVVYPKDTITLIVKGTFELKQDAPVEAVCAEDQLLPTGDLYYDGDPQNSVRYESDFAYFKPKADVMVVGHCHVPNGEFAEASSVAFQVGSICHRGWKNLYSVSRLMMLRFMFVTGRQIFLRILVKRSITPW